MLAIFFLVPVLYFTLTILSSRRGREQETMDKETPDSGAGAPEREIKPCSVHIIIGIAGVIALIFIWAVLIPVGFSLILPHTPFEHLNVPKALDTLITRVSPNGTTEWQTASPGYSLEPVRVKSLPDCRYIFYGSYWMPGEPWVATRSMQVDCRGTLVWDMYRTLDRGDQNPGMITSVDPAGGNFLVTLSNGRIQWQNTPAGCTGPA